jgi:hypothetical protein
MFRGVNRPFYPEDLLRARDVRVVRPLMAKVSESGTVFGAGQYGHPRSAGATVQIDANSWAPAAYNSDRGRENVVHIGIVLK